MTPATRERPGAVAVTLLEVPAMAKGTPAERFWAKVDRNGPVPESAPHLGPCWVWTGRLHLGYGTFSAQSRHYRAHRFSYELHVGPIPDGLVLDHLCRAKHCVNPSHLEAVTQAENLRRGSSPSALNARKTHCKRGHEFTPENIIPAPNGGRHCRTCVRTARVVYRLGGLMSEYDAGEAITP